MTLRARTAAWLGSLSLRRKLLLGFGLLIALVLAVGGLSVMLHRHEAAKVHAHFTGESRIADLVVQSSLAMLRARRNEKDFLLKLRIFGFDEARSRYVTQLRLQLATVRDNMAGIARLTANPEMATLAQSVLKVANDYEAGFLKTVALYARLAGGDHGLEALLQTRGRELEELLQREGGGLVPGVLALRQMERDLPRRYVAADLQRFHATLSRVNAELAAGGTIPGARLQTALDGYRQAFVDTARVIDDIDLTMQAYLETVSTIESALQRMYTRALAEKAGNEAAMVRLGADSVWVGAAGSLIAALLGLMLAYLVMRSAQQMMDRCVRFAERIARGDWQARIEPASGDEFGVLAQALNRMAAEIDRSSQHEQLRVAELTRLNRLLRVLSQCNNTLVHAATEDDLVRNVCAQLVESGGFRLAWVGYVENDEAMTVRPVARAGAAAGYLDEITISWGAGQYGKGPGGVAIREGRTVLVRNSATDPAFDPWVGSALRHGLRSLVAIPLLVRGRIIGMLAIYAAEIDAFDEAEVGLLEELAGDLAYGIGSLREAAALEGAERELDYRARYDALTGLANQELFRDRLTQAAVHAARTTRLAAVLMLNVDRFTRVVENLGQAASDGVLKHVGQRLAAALRDGDTVARWTGDEFAIVLTDVLRAEDVMPVARKLLAAVAEPMMLDNVSVYVTASAGIGLYPRDGADAEALVKNARTAMYSAKSLGGNVVRFFAPEMNERASARMALESGLRQALEQDALAIYFQPKVNLATGALTGAEALLRWPYQDVGLISPQEFIPVAEETGLIHPLGDWVLINVCRHIRRWREQGLAVPPIAVNLSPRQFRHEGLVDYIQSTLQEAGIEPALLEFEITESALMDNLAEAARTLHALKAIGVRLALDDFGTGYSSLNYLKRFPIDHLKIDRAFVREVTTDADDAAICTAIIGLAHSLKLKVIAEGVETEPQLDYLRTRGCDEMQGYYFSPPLPADQFVQMLVRQRRLGLLETTGAAG